MKWMSLLMMVIVMVIGVGSAVAQMDTTAVAEESAPIQISDTEAGNIVKTINGYMQGALNRGNLVIFDRKKGANVTLRMDRIVTDDPTRVIFPEDGKVIICGEFTQVEGPKVDPDSNEADLYQIWFVIKRGNMVTTKVLDTIVKSVNGNPMYKWTQDAAGAWTSTLVPDAE